MKKEDIKDFDISTNEYTKTDVKLVVKEYEIKD